MTEFVKSFYEMNSITLKELPQFVTYSQKDYKFVTHLEEVALRAEANGEEVLKVTITNRKRRGMEYLPQFNHRFVRNYYYIANIKKPLLTYYKNELGN